MQAGKQYYCVTQQPPDGEYGPGLQGWTLASNLGASTTITSPVAPIEDDSETDVPTNPHPASPEGPLPARGGEQQSWKPDNASSDYTFTEADKMLLATQTAEERRADKAAFAKVRKRLDTLNRGAKRRELGPDEKQELTELRALQERTGRSQRALGRKDVEEVLKAAGFTVAEWFGGIQRGTFLGVPLRVHKLLAERLTQAERSLVANIKVNPDELDATNLGAALGMDVTDKGSSDLRVPATAVGGSSLSLHTFGLAVDLNYKGNPFLGNASALAPEIVERATGLVTGTRVNVLTYLSDAKSAYGTLEMASEALTTYFSYRGPAGRAQLEARVRAHTPVGGEPSNVSDWLQMIEEDYATLNNRGDFKHHKPPEEGFLDFDEAVVMALTDAGLKWGGTYRKAKDIMHFDLRGGGDGQKIDAARQEHVKNQ